MFQDAKQNKNAREVFAQSRTLTFQKSFVIFASVIARQK